MQGSPRTTNQTATTQPAFADSLMDSFVDFSQCEGLSYQSPQLSPAASVKSSLTPPTKTETPPSQTSLLSSNQPFTAPSHQYGLYKQQTGIVPGALQSTFAANQINPHINAYNTFGGFLGMGSTDDLFASQGGMTTPTSAPDFDFSSPVEFQFDETINPSSIGGQESSTLPSPESLTPPSLSPPPMTGPNGTVGRAWPGMHQQAALAKAQHQKEMSAARQQIKQAHRKSKSPQPTDPLTEQKIAQVLNGMRAKPAPVELVPPPTQANMIRGKKDESEMDEDEKLLMSEEGKKMDSKARRQLRNKVSARAFRSRRKEYIAHLEYQLAARVNDNGLLRSKNNALMEENKRLTDLTRMLLSSPCFSEFLNQLSEEHRESMSDLPADGATQPTMVPTGGSQPQPQQQPAQSVQPQVRRKDVNPYAVQQQHPSTNLAMIPEESVDFSQFFEVPVDGFTYQPQVYAAAVDVAEPIDAGVLSGKTTTFVGPATDDDSDEPCESMLSLLQPGKTTTFVGQWRDDDADEAKGEVAAIDRPAAPALVEEEPVANAPIDEAFEANPEFALYHESPVPDVAASAETAALKDMATQLSRALTQAPNMVLIESEKESLRSPVFELVDKAEKEKEEEMAVARVMRIGAALDAVAERLERLL
ncbi:hypothetical protein VTK26DRAFT_5341 [Humicola hyalothermophila]